MSSSTPAPAIRPSRSVRRGRSPTEARGYSSSIRPGKFVREIGQDSYGFLVAQQVRIDPQDNIWVVDQMSSMVIKFDPNGQVQLLLGRKPVVERAAGPWRRRRLDAQRARARGAALLPVVRLRQDAEGAGGLPGGQQSDVFQRPTDVAWDAAGNIYVADGYGNARVAKFDKNGKFIKSWGSKRDRERPVQHGPRNRDRCAGQCLRCRHREQADSGLRRRRNLQDADRQRGQSGGALHHARDPVNTSTAPTPTRPRISTSTARSTRWS